MSTVKINENAGKDSLPFTDVNASRWYYSSVKFAYEKGLMNGTGNATFSPNADTTRGMIVTMLARLEGQNTSGTPWLNCTPGSGQGNDP